MEGLTRVFGYLLNLKRRFGLLRLGAVFLFEAAVKEKRKFVRIFLRKGIDKSEKGWYTTHSERMFVTDLKR